MGIIRAAINSVSGELSDSYLDAYKSAPMDKRTAVAPGWFHDAGQGKNTNTKRTNNIISNGSKVQVAPGQLMCLVDGGRVVDYTAEPGYYQVQNSSAPSLFNGEFGATLKNGWERIKYGGNNYQEQRIVFINLRPMEGIKFGTRNPIGYYDENYDIDVRVRTNGTFSLQIVEPWLFFNEVMPEECVMEGAFLNVEDFLNDTFMSEFNGALAQALSKLSSKGVRISRMNDHTMELAQFMREVLDPVWKEERGIIIKNVGCNGITYDQETQQLLTERSRVAMFKSPEMRETMVQTSIARGIEAAGSNPNGAAAGFLGIGMGMNAASGFMNTASATNLQQMQMQQQMQQQQMQQPVQPAPQAVAAVAAGGWNCSCGHQGNTGKFCAQCGSPKPAPAPAAGNWFCPSCGAANTGRFCAECGAKRPEAPKKIKCDKCGYEPDMNSPIPKFCPECGDPINEADYQ